MEGMMNYFIPEDGDTQEHMNVFPLPQKTELSLESIQQEFPLPEPHEIVPTFNGLVVCKVSRLPTKDDNNHSSSLRGASSPKGSIVDKNPSTSNPTAEPTTTVHEDLITTETPVTNVVSTPSKEKPLNNDLVGLLSEPTTGSGTPPAVSSPRMRAAPATSNDPFNFLDSNHHPPSSPNRNPLSPSPGIPSNFNPRGGMSHSQSNSPRMNQMHRVPSGNSMPISQMSNMSMAQQQQQRGGNFQSPPQSNFQGLQWQGMGNGQNRQQQNGQQQQQQRRNW